MKYGWFIGKILGEFEQVKHKQEKYKRGHEQLTRQGAARKLM